MDVKRCLRGSVVKVRIRTLQSITTGLHRTGWKHPHHRPIFHSGKESGTGSLITTTSLSIWGTNLPHDACVEVPCLVSNRGIQPTVIGDLPQICAAMNRTNINVQLMTIEAAVTKKKDAIYQAAMMDPHTASELSIDEIVALCDDLIEAHRGWLPEYN